LVWGAGGRQAAGDYSSPMGRVVNSKTDLTSGSLGVGWFGDLPFVNLTYSANEGRFGVPYAGQFHGHDHSSSDPAFLGERTAGEPGSNENPDSPPQVDETVSWQSISLNAGYRELNHYLSKFRFSGNFTRWLHREVEDGGQVATAFDNQAYNFRGVWDQRRTGRWSGSFGFQA
jgi:hypothetical protein